jgi:hypothetical protein
LVKHGAIKLAVKGDSENIQVNYICEQSDCVVKVHNLQNLGFRYLAYKGEKYKPCADCGEYFKYVHTDANYCKRCIGYKVVENKAVICVDCNKEFVIDARVMIKDRCEDCYKDYRRRYYKDYKRTARGNLSTGVLK